MEGSWKELKKREGWVETDKKRMEQERGRSVGAGRGRRAEDEKEELCEMGEEKWKCEMRE